MSNSKPYTLEREFDAPRDLVWQAWTDPDLLAKWYGPGADTIIHKFDLKAGGVWLNEMKWGERSMFSKITFQDISPKDLIVWNNSTAVADWNIIASPMMENWPMTLEASFSFKDLGDKTKVTLKWIPHGASAAEIASFSQAVSGMSKGWGSGFDILDTILAGIQA